MTRSLLLAAPAALLVVLLTGCQPATPAELEAELEQITGVSSVTVAGTDVKATLVYGISAEAAEMAILELRDQAVEQHQRAADVGLSVFIQAEPDDDDNSTWEVYSYGEWLDGAGIRKDFAQQAAFVASLAEWDALLDTPARVEQIQFSVYGATDQRPEVTVGQSLPSPNDAADIGVLTAGLRDLWVASGGSLDAVSIR